MYIIADTRREIHFVTMLSSWGRRWEIAPTLLAHYWILEDTFTIFEIQTWLPDFIMGMARLRIWTAWPVWAEVPVTLGIKTKLSSLSIDRQLKFKITGWPKLGNKAAENGNKSIKCTGSYFTAVKASSYWSTRIATKWQAFCRWKF